MNKELLLLKGLVSDFPQSDQDEIKLVTNQIKDLVESAGDNGVFALTFVGLEYQDK